MSKLKISNSQCNRYMQCGENYRLYYVERIRPTSPKCSLVFGTALDRAVGAILEPKDKSPESLFDYFFRFSDVNGKQVYIPKCADMLYAKRDFDKDLLTEEDYSKIQEEYSMNKEAALELMKLRLEKGHKFLNRKQQEQANFIFWHSMRRKGHILIDGFRKKVMPRITKVISAQEYIELANDEGDKVIGYVDLVAEISGHDKPVILDLKTSAMEYDADAHLTSPQLTLYYHVLKEKYQTDEVGFVVLNKNIMKNKVKTCSLCGADGTGTRYKSCAAEINDRRCNGEWIEKIDPECFVQIIIGKIPEATENLVIDNITDIAHAIKIGHYTKNLNTCFDNFGGICEYLPLCYKGKMEELEKLE